MIENYGEGLIKAWEEAQLNGIKQVDFARQIGLTHANLRNRLHYARLVAAHPVNNKLFDVVSFGTPMELVGDFIVVGDLHVPYTDTDFCDRIGEVAVKHLPKPRKLMLAGDVFSMDHFSSYAQVVAHPSWTQERDAIRNLLEIWLDVFDEIDIIMGNHERRMQKFVVGAFEETDIWAMIYSNPDRLRTSNFGYCTIRSGGVSWRITHPKNYSQISMSVAEKVANKHQTNVITHHEHHFGITFDRYGHFVLVNNGCMADPDKMPYVALDDNATPAMMKGFCMLKGGVPHLYSDRTDFTDWSMI